MTLSPPAELGQAEIKRGAAVLLYLLTWRDGFGNDEAVCALREAKLDAAIVVTAQGRTCVDGAVLTAFLALAGRAVVWDRVGRVWRGRRECDPA